MNTGDIKVELLLHLLDLTQRQEVLLQEENVDGFIELIDERQFLLNKIQEFNMQNPNVNKEGNGDILDKLIKIDTRNRIEFERQFNDAKDKLRKLRQMRKGESTYYNLYDTSREEGVFFDKRNK